MAPSLSIVVPTRGRPRYLAVTLASIVPQASARGAEVVVVCDGPQPASRAAAERAGASVVELASPRGANAARNAGVAAGDAELVVLVDDDIDAAPGWLDAYLRAAEQHADVDVFGGPIRPRLEGPAPRSCGRHGPPYTFLDFGAGDREVDYVWSANMMVRRRALERVGAFDETLAGSGEEEEWQDRVRAAGGHVRYVAAAAVDHRRVGPDARLRALVRTAWGRGRASRRYTVIKGPAPTLIAEARVLVACLAHAARRRCPMGLALAAHSGGRLREALHPAARAPADAFLSGRSGHVAGRRAVLRRAADHGLDALDTLTARRRGLERAARTGATQSVLALILQRAGAPNTAAASRAELLRSRHRVHVVVADAKDAGKFANLNELLQRHGTDGVDWLLVVDDDVVLPEGFLDAFLFLAGRYGLRLAQPAQTLASHAAWDVVRRRPLSAVRETSFVEIGPVTAFHRDTFAQLLPFPPLRAGWGLDHHWAALARERGWTLGVVDAVPVRHELRPVASQYGHAAAVAEARAFLAGRPHVGREEIRTLAVHRHWR
jgi:GT2 family glycosyltransferase